MKRCASQMILEGARFKCETEISVRTWERGTKRKADARERDR